MIDMGSVSCVLLVWFSLPLLRVSSLQCPLLRYQEGVSMCVWSSGTRIHAVPIPSCESSSSRVTIIYRCIITCQARALRLGR